MTNTLSIDTQALALENLLRNECSTRGLEFEKVRNVLFSKWFENKKDTLGAEVRAILDKAYACTRVNDEAGYRAACLEWLRTVHDVGPGDTIRLDCHDKVRILRIEGVRISIRDNDLQQSTVAFMARSLSDKEEGAISQEYWRFIDEPVEKVQVEDAK